MWSIQFDQHNLYIVGASGQTLTALPNNKWGAECAGKMLEWKNDIWLSYQRAMLKIRAA